MTWEKLFHYLNDGLEDQTTVGDNVNVSPLLSKDSVLPLISEALEDPEYFESNYSDDILI